MRTTILVADDDPITQSVLSGYLEDLGFEVTCAPSGQAALELICRRSFSAFLLDLYMDDMSGLDVLHEIRQTPRLADRPVLMISAEKHPASMEVALQFGANDYLTKPIVPHWLRAKLSRHLPRAGEGGELTPEMRLGRYEIRGSLGRSFYLAEDPRLRRKVALKLAAEAEAIAMARVSHPAVLVVHALGSEPAPYIVCEYCQGEPLRPGLTESVVGWTLQILEALEALHQAGVVVANLSPETVWLTHEGRIKLIDLSAAVTEHGGDGIAASAAAAFVAPEQVDPLFGPTAAILHYLITGSGPFTPEQPFQQLLAQAFAQPEAMGEAVPTALQEICRKGLQKNQDERFQSAREFHQALSAM